MNEVEAQIISQVKQDISAEDMHTFDRIANIMVANLTNKDHKYPCNRMTGNL